MTRRRIRGISKPRPTTGVVFPATREGRLLKTDDIDQLRRYIREEARFHMGTNGFDSAIFFDNNCTKIHMSSGIRGRVFVQITLPNKKVEERTYETVGMVILFTRNVIEGFYSQSWKLD